MKAWLILGCEGHIDKKTGFQLCTSVENRILDLDKIKASDNYLNLIRYLDRVPKLFNGTCFKTNLVTNTIYKIYELGYLEERLYQCIAYFYDKHKHCGIILKLRPK